MFVSCKKLDLMQLLSQACSLYTSYNHSTVINKETRLILYGPCYRATAILVMLSVYLI